MVDRFKNAKCEAGMPEHPGWQSAPAHLRCKRLKLHPGRHQVKFEDAYRRWNGGDLESAVEPHGPTEEEHDG